MPRTPLWGGKDMDRSEPGSVALRELPPQHIERLTLTYGSGWREVVALLEADRSLAATVGTTPTLKAEVVYALRCEMAQTLSDCVFRRTDLGTAGHPGERALADCASVAAAELGWSTTRTCSDLAEVRSRFHAACAP